MQFHVIGVYIRVVDKGVGILIVDIAVGYLPAACAEDTLLWQRSYELHQTLCEASKSSRPLIVIVNDELTVAVVIEELKQVKLPNERE